MRDVLLNLLYPRGAKCLVCGDPRRADAEDGLCPRCREMLAEERVPASSCDRCLSRVEKDEPCRFCKSGGMAFLDRTYAPYRYLTASRKLVQKVKFAAVDDGLSILCSAMADALPARDFDCIVPVPLHPNRQRDRGVNQALLLAQGVAVRTGMPVADVLMRTRDTQPQSGLSRTKRKKNVENAFVISTGASLQGKRVLLVDDVRTTGSTARACAKALLDAGAACVSLCVSCVVWTYRGE